ncbi:MAG: hypothetical protein IKS45_11525, partial [Thermoguttaceae bacterium]|nr:hypothetical protein [Thermoguttaceae bacterium]
MNIKFYGDLWVTPQNVGYDPYINQADYIFCNLETPITDETNGTLKAGPVLEGSLSGFEAVHLLYGFLHHVGRHHGLKAE